MRTLNDILEYVIDEHPNLIDSFMEEFRINSYEPDDLKIPLKKDELKSIFSYLSDNGVTGLNESQDIPADVLKTAKNIYDTEGVAQHINFIDGEYVISDWYDSDTTVKSFGVDLYENDSLIKDISENRNDIAHAVKEIYGSMEAGQKAFEEDKQSFYDEVIGQLDNSDSEAIISTIDEMFNVQGNLSESRQDIANAVKDVYGSMEAGQKAFEQNKQSFYDEIKNQLPNTEGLESRIDSIFNLRGNLSESASQIWSMSEYGSIDRLSVQGIMETASFYINKLILDSLATGIAINQETLISSLLNLVNQPIGATILFTFGSEENYENYLRTCSQVALDKFSFGEISSIDIIREIFKVANGGNFSEGINFEALKNNGENVKISRLDNNIEDILSSLFKKSDKGESSKVYFNEYTEDIVAISDSVKNIIIFHDFTLFDSLRLIDIAYHGSNDLLSSSIPSVDSNHFSKDALAWVSKNTDNKVLSIFIDSLCDDKISIDDMNTLYFIEPNICDLVCSFGNIESSKTVLWINVLLNESIGSGSRTVEITPATQFDKDKLRYVNPQTFQNSLASECGGVSVSESEIDVSEKSAVTKEQIIKMFGITEADAMEILNILNDKYEPTKLDESFSIENLRADKDVKSVRMNSFNLQSFIRGFEEQFGRKVNEEEFGVLKEYWDKPLNLSESAKPKKQILDLIFESKKLKGSDKLWKLHESVDAPIQTYADMVVFNTDGKVLLMQRGTDCDFEPNKWGFVGGKVQVGETTENGAIRECLEESGLNCSEVERIGEFSNEDGSVSHYYTGITEDDVVMSDESQNYSWVDPSEVKNFDLILGNVDRYNEILGENEVSFEQGVETLYESKVSSILSDLASGDIAEIVGLVSSPKRYAKASIGRVILDKLNSTGIVGDKATKIADKILKLYPATVGVFSFFDSLLESTQEEIKVIEDNIKELKERGDVPKEEIDALKQDINDLKIKNYEDEIEKLKVRVNALNSEISIEKDASKKQKLEDKKKTYEDRLKSLGEKINNLKADINKLGAEADTFLDDPFSVIS